MDCLALASLASCSKSSSSISSRCHPGKARCGKIVEQILKIYPIWYQMASIIMKIVVHICCGSTIFNQSFMYVKSRATWIGKNRKKKKQLKEIYIFIYASFCRYLWRGGDAELSDSAISRRFPAVTKTSLKIMIKIVINILKMFLAQW